MRDTSGVELASDLVDVRGLSLDALESLGDTVFADVLAEVLNPRGEGCAAFTSALV